MPEPQKQTPIAVEQLGQVFGPSIGYHISRCRQGGYLVIVDGAVYAARTELHEAIAVMGQVAANQYSESAVPPERAKDVTPQLEEYTPPGIRPGTSPRIVHPPQTQPASADLAERVRATVTLVLGMLAAGASAVVGV